MHIYLHIYEKSRTFAAWFLVLYIEKKFIINIFACGGNYLLWRCGYALTGNVKFIYKYTGSGIDALTRQSELTTQVFLIFLLFLDIFVSASAFFFTNKTTINMKTIITRAIAAQKRLFVLFSQRLAGLKSRVHENIFLAVDEHLMIIRSVVDELQCALEGGRVAALPIVELGFGLVAAVG